MRITKIAGGVAFFVFLILGVFFSVLVSKPFYKYEYEAHKVQISFSDLSESQYMDYSGQIINYFFTNANVLSIKNKNGFIINGYFTEREIVHMRDVKHLVRFFMLLMSFCAVIFALIIIYTKDKCAFLKTLPFFSIVIALVLVTIAFVDFNGAFIVFHKIFFRNNFWLLPENTKLIEMFPEVFFYDFAKLWIFLFLGINAVIYFVSTFLVCSKNA